MRFSIVKQAAIIAPSCCSSLARVLASWLLASRQFKLHHYPAFPKGTGTYRYHVHAEGSQLQSGDALGGCSGCDWVHPRRTLCRSAEARSVALSAGGQRGSVQPFPPRLENRQQCISSRSHAPEKRSRA